MWSYEFGMNMFKLLEKKDTNLSLIASRLHETEKLFLKYFPFGLKTLHQSYKSSFKICMKLKTFCFFFNIKNTLLFGLKHYNNRVYEFFFVTDEYELLIETLVGFSGKNSN